MQYLQNTSPALDTYDPNWEDRWNNIHEQISLAQQEGASSEYLLERLYEAFHAQFRTEADYKNWAYTQLQSKADRENKFLVLSDLPENATVEQIRDWQRSGYQMLAEQDYGQLSVGQSESITGFRSELPADCSRNTFRLTLNGSGVQNLEARCTIEQSEKKAFVCIHHLPGCIGTSPTNAIEAVATHVKSTYLSCHDVQAVDFFIHIPSAVAGHFGERFSRIELTWTDRGYANPVWRDLKELPAAIRDAEAMPFEEPPCCKRSVKLPARSLASKLIRLFR